MLKHESIYLEWPKPPSKESLHVRRLWSESLNGRDSIANEPRVPVMLLHGAVENGRIFYSESGKGLAPFLARNGFEVYVPDLRGRGLSKPSISRESRYGQFEAITEEIPAFIELIRERQGDVPQFWMAHSWGGILLLSMLARSPEYRKLVRGIVFFGTKRQVHVQNLEKFIKIDLFWKTIARALVKVHGYLPARRYGFGADDETDLSHLESKLWVEPGQWVDPRDGFDYGEALTRTELPPLFFLAGQNDRCLGHPHDVRNLIKELGPQEVEFRLLSKFTGYHHDYGHIDMLTHPNAQDDHFREVVRWVRAQLKPRDA